MSKSRLLSDVNLFYAHAGLFAFSEIIFLLSIPVLLIERGFALSFVFAFYAFAALPGYFLTTSIIRHLLHTSIKRVLILGVLLYIVLGFISPFIQLNNYWWMAAFVLLTLQALFYFPARHLYFSEIISHKKIGFQSGMLNAIMAIARTIAPIMGGLIVVATQLDSVFIFGALTMILSVLPILFIKTKIEAHFNLQEFKKTIKSHPVFLGTRSAYVADGVNSMMSYLFWPVLFYLFISQKDYFELSSLMTVTYGVAALIMVAVGHYFDREHRKPLLKFSIISNILASVGRFSLLFFNPLLFVYAVQSFYLFSESALQSTFEAYWYSYSKKTNTIFFTIHREINYALGRFAIGILLSAVSLFWTRPAQLWSFFLISIPVVFMYLSKAKMDHHLGNNTK